MAEQYEFDIDLFPGGDEDSGYHMQNLPGEVQREYLIQRGSGRMVKGRLVDVIHGHLATGGEPATLIVATFKFLGTKSERFRYAKITWSFAYDDPNDNDCPQVAKISLDDQFVMNQTTVNESTELSATAALQAGAPVATANISSGWKRTQSVESSDQISLYGSTTFSRRGLKGPDGAKWILEENKSQKSGIPSSLTTAVLLKRKDKIFEGTVQVKVSAGFDEVMANYFGMKPKVDPVKFDPTRKPSSDKYNTQKLDDINLDDINTVKFRTPLPTASV
jgi:hypothetical protein